MKQFKFKLFIKTGEQEFNVSRINIIAKDYDSARKIFDSKEPNIPFHHFATVESENIKPTN